MITVESDSGTISEAEAVLDDLGIKPRGDHPLAQAVRHPDINGRNYAWNYLVAHGINFENLWTAGFASVFNALLSGDPNTKIEPDPGMNRGVLPLYMPHVAMWSRMASYDQYEMFRL